MRRLTFLAIFALVASFILVPAALYVPCQVCKLPPAWSHLSYLVINCGCLVPSSVRSSFASDPALK
jgi:hypothetical protein